MTEDGTPILAIIAILCICLLVYATGREIMPKRMQSALEKAGRKLLRWRRENPIVSLQFDSAPSENQRQDAILDWLDRP